MTTTVLFVPAFQTDFKIHAYDDVIAAIEQRGYRVITVPIEWEGTGPAEWLRQLQQEYSRHDPATTVLAGFSFGAMIALMAAAELSPIELWLCSLSPWFSEDIPARTEEQLSYLPSGLVDKLRGIMFSRLADRIDCKTLLFIGQKESEGVRLRVEEASRLIRDATVVTVPGASHNIAHPDYATRVYQSI